jgi:excinuclease ABC subunit A
MPAEVIKISGARQHNLKNLHVEIPREKLVVITGLSGSGKSSLAFDTLYAEGQRRYVESLSAYARQFLDQMEKPDVDFIEGLVACHRHRTTQRRREPTIDNRNYD